MDKLHHPRKAQIAPLFSVPIYRGNLDLPHEVVADDCKKSCDRAKDTGGNASYTNFFDREARNLLYQATWWQRFKKQVFSAYEFFQAAANGGSVHPDDYFFMFAWANYYQLDDVHHTHIHHQAMVSGTYYARVNEVGAPIRFINPHDMANMLFSPDNSNVETYHGFEIAGAPHNHTEAVYYPKTGDILLWPAFVPHAIESGRQQGAGQDYERVSISFNLSHWNMQQRNEDELYTQNV